MKRYLMNILCLSAVLLMMGCGAEEQESDVSGADNTMSSPFANSGVGGAGARSYVPPSQPVQADPDGGIGDAASDAGVQQGVDGENTELSNTNDADGGDDTGEVGGPCTPSCGGKNCGDDGCGGSCGECPLGSSCDGVVCINEAFGLCEAAEGNYEGQFSGQMAFGATGLPDFNLETTGALVMTLDCASLEASLEGTFSGAIADTTYTLSLSGTADFGKGELEWEMSEGSVLAVGGQVLYQVEGSAWSTEFNGEQWTGNWELKSTSASSVGGNLSQNDIKPLSGSGDWAMGKTL